jgi:hypothetical protein
VQEKPCTRSRTDENDMKDYNILLDGSIIGTIKARNESSALKKALKIYPKEYHKDISIE